MLKFDPEKKIFKNDRLETIVFYSFFPYIFS